MHDCETVSGANIDEKGMEQRSIELQRVVLLLGSGLLGTAALLRRTSKAPTWSLQVREDRIVIFHCEIRALTERDTCSVQSCNRSVASATVTVQATASAGRRFVSQSFAMILEPTWKVHVTTWLRFFIGNRLGPYHAMPQHVIDGLLNLADGWRMYCACTSMSALLPNRLTSHFVAAVCVCRSVSSDDVLYDMGCGDGRLLIEAAKQRRVKQAVGVELNPTLAQLAEQNIQTYLTSSFPPSSTHPPPALSIQHTDARTADVSPASVVTLYLSHRGNRQLRPLLSRQLLRQPKCRVASFCFDMDGWTPVKQSRVSGIPLYLYNQHSISDKLKREAG